MKEDILLHKIILLNQQTKILFKKSIKEVAKKHDMSKSEVFILFAIFHNPKLGKSSDIVKEHNYSKAYVSNAINSLKNNDYIKLTTDTSDKRYQKIELLDKSKGIIDELNKNFIENVSVMRKGISNDDLKIFMNTIDLIINNIKNDKGEMK